MPSLVIIRGMPGTGKTTIAKKLKSKLEENGKQVRLHHLDEVKDKNGPGGLDEAYDEAAKIIKSSANNYRGYIIIDEVGYSPTIIKVANEIAGRDGVRSFLITRHIEDVLGIHKERSRRNKKKIINSRATLVALEKMINEQPIKNEVTIYNNDIDDSVDKIYSHL